MADDAAKAMFGTWKYDAETDEVQILRRSFDPVTARSSQHQACNRCHAKKLKCSGDKNGCERCIAGQLACEYTRSSSRSSRRGKKTSRPHSGASGREISPGGQASSSSRHSRGRSHLSPSSAAAPSVVGTALNDDFDHLLRPEDAFPMGLIAGPSSSGVAYSTSAAVAGYPAVSAYQWPAQGYGIPGSGADAAVSYAMSSGHSYADAEYDDYTDYSGYQNTMDDPRYWSGRGR